MDLGEPASVVLPRGTAAVLRVLAGADTAFTMRRLAGLAQVSHRRVQQVILRLADHGLVRTEEQGPAVLCRFNWDHLAARPLVEIVRLRERLFELVKAELMDWPFQPEHVSIFGSAARGDGGTHSDLDILIVRPTRVGDDDSAWLDQLSRSAERIHAATGNDVAWFDLSADELRKAARRGEAIVAEWRRDAIHFAGTDLRRLLGGNT